MTNPKARLLTDEVVRTAVAIMRRTITSHPCAGCEQAELRGDIPRVGAGAFGRGTRPDILSWRRSYGLE